MDAVLWGIAKARQRKQGSRDLDSPASANTPLRDPAPIQFESCTMPSCDRLRLHKEERLLPPRPKLPQHDPEQAIRCGKSRLRMVLRQDRGLLSQCKVFQQQAGPEGHRVGRGAGRYHPAQAVQDRGAGPYQRPARVAGDELLLSLEAHLRSGLRCSALLIMKNYPNRSFPFGRAAGPAELCPDSKLGTEKVPPRMLCSASGSTPCRKTTLLTGSAMPLPLPAKIDPREIWRLPKRHARLKRHPSLACCVMGTARYLSYLASTTPVRQIVCHL